MASFERIARELVELEVQHAELLPGEPALARVTEQLARKRAELAALPNPVVAELVLLRRLDKPFLDRVTELVVKRRLLMARVGMDDPEFKTLTARIRGNRDRVKEVGSRAEALRAIYSAAPTIPVGEWVRVTVPEAAPGSLRRAEGRVIGLSGDTLTWQRALREPNSIQLPPDAVVERVVARRGRGWEGAALGLVAGGVIGKIRRGPYDDQADLRLIVFAPTGALIGGLLGSMIQAEEWAPVGWRHARIVLAPAGLGGGLGWALPRLGRSR
jgi:hypothetical protein